MSPGVRASPVIFQSLAQVTETASKTLSLQGLLWPSDLGSLQHPSLLTSLARSLPPRRLLAFSLVLRDPFLHRSTTLRRFAFCINSPLRQLSSLARSGHSFTLLSPSSLVTSLFNIRHRFLLPHQKSQNQHIPTKPPFIATRPPFQILSHSNTYASIDSAFWHVDSSISHSRPCYHLPIIGPTLEHFVSQDGVHA